MSSECGWNTPTKERIEHWKKTWQLDVVKMSAIKGKDQAILNYRTEAEIDRQYREINLPLEKAIAYFGIQLLDNNADSVLAGGLRRYIVRCTVNHFTSYQRVPELESQDP